MSILTRQTVQKLLQNRPASPLVQTPEDRDQRTAAFVPHPRDYGGQEGRKSNEDKNSGEVVGAMRRVCCNINHHTGGGAIGADQSGGANSWTGAGGDDVHVVQHAAGGRDCISHANFSGDESVERGRLGKAVVVEFGRDDRPDQSRFVVEPANSSPIL